MRIDFHTHVVASDLPDFAERYGDKRWPVLVNNGRTGQLVRNGKVVRTIPADCWSPDRRLEHMDSTGIDLQVLSPLPPLIGYWPDAAKGAEFDRRMNDSIAGIVADRPTRFAGLGSVPLQNVDTAISVLVEAQSNGLSGVEIGTRVESKELNDPELRPFFTAAAELGMTIFLHPLVLGPESDWTDRINTIHSNFGIGMTTDTAIAAAALILGGVKAELPSLRICLAHGGGTFVWALARVGRIWSEDGPSLSMLLENVYVDTVVYDSRNVRYLEDTLGGGQLLFGTDYPLPAADVRAQCLDDLSQESLIRVSARNAWPLLSTAHAELEPRIQALSTMSRALEHPLPPLRFH